MQNVEINIIGVLVSMLVVVLLALCIQYILYHYKKRQHYFIQEVEFLKLNYEKELLRAQLEIQEQTFQHISLELHDNVGHYISLAKLQLVTLNGNDEDLSGKLSSSVDLLGTSLQEIRTLCSNLNTSNLKNNGLIKTVEQQVEQLSKSGQFDVAFTVKGKTVYMDEKKELILFRIIQEGLNNIIKHSQANKIRIQLAYCKDDMELTVTDNGRGFDVQKCLSGATASSGIRNIVNRSLLINASQKIWSEPGKGTTIRITTPYQ
ncbi:MAG: hypothetical protein INR73_05285 [Williamsia sp.]|nr:hypothetical protein [Williamsia sp.]